MTISMYQASVPVLIRQLEAVSAFLGKAEDYAEEQGLDAQELLDGKLAPDMLAFPRQIQIMTDMAKGGGARLAGQEAPAYADDETSFAQLRERIAKTVAYLNTLSATDIDGSEERDIVLKIAGNEMPFKGQAYLLGFVLPNVFFHATAAYAILRNKGVPLGKRDFLGGV
ncbi:hypothetical protein FHS31_000388 [Sphingomonas vulcanisoli]|uniref:DUF1993 domain-containing protein n=1 Tax=Sphingomonas vulcanisoli TaxID=1658060 RepID=A0ABX0TT62_9SPHN|nr:DUF1993 domain-containing protein [Sphingomonas vulcanisoli]NIJ06806.1 hypothetical protein [Sphingomonas vulcanisoli]